MKILAQIILKRLRYIIPRQKKFLSNKEEKYTITKVERNSLCYCNSGKKYKKCHLIKNSKKGKIAVKYTDSKGLVKIKLRSPAKYKIEVKNTFTEIEVGMGAD